MPTLSPSAQTPAPRHAVAGGVRHPASAATQAGAASAAGALAAASSGSGGAFGRELRAALQCSEGAEPVPDAGLDTEAAAGPGEAASEPAADAIAGPEASAASPAQAFNPGLHTIDDRTAGAAGRAYGEPGGAGAEDHGGVPGGQAGSVAAVARGATPATGRNTAAEAFAGGFMPPAGPQTAADPAAPVAGAAPEALQTGAKPANRASSPNPAAVRTALAPATHPAPAPLVGLTPASTPTALACAAPPAAAAVKPGLPPAGLGLPYLATGPASSALAGGGSLMAPASAAAPEPDGTRAAPGAAGLAVAMASPLLAVPGSAAVPALVSTDAPGPAASSPAYAIADEIGSAAFTSSLGAQLSVLARDGIEQARVLVNPEQMGPISVQLALDGTQVRVELAAESGQTRQLLQEALPGLAGALREAGFTLAGGGVFEQSRDGARPQGGHPENGGSHAGRATSRPVGSLEAAPDSAHEGNLALQAARLRPVRLRGLVDTFA